MIRFGYLIRGDGCQVHQEANPATENSAAVEIPAAQRERIQMVLLRESGMTQQRSCRA